MGDRWQRPQFWDVDRLRLHIVAELQARLFTALLELRRELRRPQCMADVLRPLEKSHKEPQLRGHALMLLRFRVLRLRMWRKKVRYDLRPQLDGGSTKLRTKESLRVLLLRKLQKARRDGSRRVRRRVH